MFTFQVNPRKIFLAVIMIVVEKFNNSSLLPWNYNIFQSNDCVPPRSLRPNERTNERTNGVAPKFILEKVDEKLQRFRIKERAREREHKYWKIIHSPRRAFKILLSLFLTRPLLIRTFSPTSARCNLVSLFHLVAFSFFFFFFSFFSRNSAIQR